MVPVTLEQRPPRHHPAGEEPTGPASPVGPVGEDAPPGSEEVLTRLRDRSAQRAHFDPGLAGGLRAWLEDGASALVAARGDGPPLFLGPRVLLGQPSSEPGPKPGPEWRSGSLEAVPYPSQVVTSYLVHALFRQLVTIGAVGDPLTDALDALRLHPHRAGLVRQVSGMNGPARAALASELATQVGHLRDLTPHFAPGWLPRTDDRVAIPLAGGRVVLSGVFDLLVGAPVAGQATVCALQLTSGGPWAMARTALHYLALLETLRHGSPPYRLGLLDSTVGRYVIEDVRQEHLRAMASHVVTRLAAMAEPHA
jgi:hypothetical protein